MPRIDATAEEKHNQGRQWLQMLNEFDVRFLALDLEMDRALVEFFQAQPGWVVDCRDEESVLFVRADSVQAGCGQAGMQGGLILA